MTTGTDKVSTSDVKPINTVTIRYDHRTFTYVYQTTEGLKRAVLQYIKDALQPVLDNHQEPAYTSLKDSVAKILDLPEDEALDYITTRHSGSTHSIMEIILHEFTVYPRGATFQYGVTVFP